MRLTILTILIVAAGLIIGANIAPAGWVAPQITGAAVQPDITTRNIG